MAELLALTDSRELQAWQALWQVHAEERKREQDAREAKDGQVFDPRAHDDEDEDEDQDGETE